MWADICPRCEKAAWTRPEPSQAQRRADADSACPAKMQTMGKALTADDILPLVVSLPAQERARLLRLIASQQGSDASIYTTMPASRDEFSADDEPLTWDAEGWEDPD